MISFRPPDAIGKPTSNEHPAVINLGTLSGGRFGLTFMVPTKNAKHAFNATVQAARKKGWQPVNTGIENDAATATFTATRYPDPPEQYLGLVTLIVGLGHQTANSTTPLEIDLTVTP